MLTNSFYPSFMMERASLELHLPIIMNSSKPLIYVAGISAAWLVVYIALSLGIKKKAQQSSVIYRRAEEQNKKQEKGVVPSKTYPTSWWKDPKVFELERRAIFSKVNPHGNTNTIFMLIIAGMVFRHPRF